MNYLLNGGYGFFMKKNKQKTKLGFKDVLAALKADWQIYILLLPMVIWFLVFMYKPMYGLIISFKDYSLFKGIQASPWVGLDNFKELLFGAGANYFWRAFKNTFLISFYGLVFGFPAPIILALMFNEVKDGIYRRGIQTLLYLPHFISEVIIAGIVIAFLQPQTGIINILLIKAGILDQGIYFLVKPEYFRSIYILSGMWKETGFASIVFFAALSGISPALYEAAKVDGATRIQQMLHVSIPGIAPTIIIMLIIRIGQLLSVGYERVLLLYQPVTYETADILNTYIYRLGLTGATDFSLATAAVFFNAIIGFVLVRTANSISRKVSETALW
jgi:putative aldouronate transport system permease protein